MRRVAIGFVLAVALAGCGGGNGAPPPSPRAVVQAWSRALNANDNESAADLFERNAQVIQAGTVLRLRTHADAVTWNEGLPCSGHIISLTVSGDTVEATFLLGPRGQGPCDGLGQRAAAVFTVRDGKIVLWHQIPPPEPAGQRV